MSDYMTGPYDMRNTGGGNFWETAGNVVSGVSQGFSMLNPVFAGVSLIGDLVSGIANIGQQKVQNARDAVSLYNQAKSAGWNYEGVTLGHESNLDKLNTAVSTAGDNLETIDRNIGKLETKRTDALDRLQEKAEEISSYQSLLKAVSGLKGGGSWNTAKSKTEEEIGKQEKNINEEVDSLIEDLETQAGTMRGDVEGFEEEGYNQLAGIFGKEFADTVSDDVLEGGISDTELEDLYTRFDEDDWTGGSYGEEGEADRVASRESVEGFSEWFKSGDSNIGLFQRGDKLEWLLQGYEVYNWGTRETLGLDGYLDQFLGSDVGAEFEDEFASRDKAKEAIKEKLKQEGLLDKNFKPKGKTWHEAHPKEQGGRPY